MATIQLVGSIVLFFFHTNPLLFLNFEAFIFWRLLQYEQYYEFHHIYPIII